MMYGFRKANDVSFPRTILLFHSHLKFLSLTGDLHPHIMEEPETIWRGWHAILSRSLLFLCLNLCDFDGGVLSEALAEITPNLLHLALFKCQCKGKLDLPSSLRSLHYAHNCGLLSCSAI